MFLTFNPHNFRYQIHNVVKAHEECFVYLEIVIEFLQQKTYKLFVRLVRRFATASSSFSLWKPSLHRQGDSWLDSTHFSSGLSTASNNTSVASDSFKLFRWVLSKNRNLQSKTYKAHCIDTTWTPFTKSVSIMKKVGQPHSSANQPSIKVSYVYLRPLRWLPWNLPPTEPVRLNEPVLARMVLLLIFPCVLPFPLWKPLLCLEEPPLLV